MDVNEFKRTLLLFNGTERLYLWKLEIHAVLNQYPNAATLDVAHCLSPLFRETCIDNGEVLSTILSLYASLEGTKPKLLESIIHCTFKSGKFNNFSLLWAAWARLAVKLEKVEDASRICEKGLTFTKLDSQWRVKEALKCVQEGTEIELKINTEPTDDNCNRSNILFYLQMRKLTDKVESIGAKIDSLEETFGKLKDELSNKIEDNRRQALSGIAHSQTEILQVTKNALISAKQEVLERVDMIQTEVVNLVDDALEGLRGSHKSNDHDNSGQRKSLQSNSENSFISFISQSQNAIKEDAQSVLAANCLISFSPDINGDPLVEPKSSIDSLTLVDIETAPGVTFESESKKKEKIWKPASTEGGGSDSYRSFESSFNVATDLKNFLDDSQFLDNGLPVVSNVNKDAIKMQLDDFLKSDSPIVFKTGRSKSTPSLKIAAETPTSSHSDRTLFADDKSSAVRSCLKTEPGISKQVDGLSLDSGKTKSLGAKIDLAPDSDRRHSLSTSEAEYTKLDSPYELIHGDFAGYTVIEDGSNDQSANNKENYTNLDETFGENVFAKKIIRDSLGYRSCELSSNTVLQSSSSANTQNLRVVVNGNNSFHSGGGGVKTPANNKVQSNRKSMLQGLSVMSPIEDEGSFESTGQSSRSSGAGYASSDSICSAANLSEAKKC